MPKTQHTSATVPAVAIVPAGWWALADASGFYPDDLPRDWRLGYFANEHAGVYLPFAVWGNMPATALAGWRDDVHGRFGLFMETPSPTGAASARLRAAHDALGDNLVAWVRWGANPVDPGTLLAPAEPGTNAPTVGQALHCPPALRDDLRGGARWLREHAAAAPATLVVLPRPTSARLGEWRRLVTLVGFADLGPAVG